MSLRVPPFFSLLRVCAKRSCFRQQPMLTKGVRACYSSGKEPKEVKDSVEEFVPTKEWKQVQDGQILPTGVEVDINLETGVKTAVMNSEFTTAARRRSAGRQLPEEVRAMKR